MKKWTNAAIRARMPWTFFSACDSTNVSPKEKQKPVSISSSSSTDRVTWMATLNHYWDNIPIKPIIFRVPAYSTLNKIVEYFCTETISSLHHKIYLRHLQPILLHFPPRESFLKQTVRMLREEYTLISCTPQQRWDLL